MVVNLEYYIVQHQLQPNHTTILQHYHIHSLRLMIDIGKLNCKLLELKTLVQIDILVLHWYYTPMYTILDNHLN